MRTPPDTPELSNTAWGPVTASTEVAPGIVSVTTATHRGLVLSDQRQRDIPAHLRLNDAAYEQTGEIYLVAFGFPDEAAALGLSLLDGLAKVGVIGGFESAELNESEACTVAYLARCVHTNQRPIVVPFLDDEVSLIGQRPYLDDWVAALASAPKVDGTWPTLRGPWHAHWNWRTRLAEETAAVQQEMSEVISLMNMGQESTGRESSWIQLH